MNVEIIHSFLPPDLLMEVKQVPTKTTQHRSNITSWNQGLLHVSGPILLFDLDEELKAKVKQVIDARFPDMVEEEVTGAVFTAGGKLSYLPWHYDSAYKMAITVYLNDQWVRDFGGALLYEHPLTADVHAIYPEFNKAVVLRPPVLHCTIMPTLQAPMRESLQIFLGYDESKVTEPGY